MTEDELLHSVTGLCDTYDPPIRWLHFGPMRRYVDGGKWRRGLPDLILLGTCRVMFRELKRAGGRPRAAQDSWLFWLREAGQDDAVWRPADWRSGRIAAALEALNLSAGQAAAAVVSDDPELAFWRALHTPRR